MVEEGSAACVCAQRPAKGMLNELNKKLNGQNIKLINANILEEARQANIKKVFAFSSVCAFPHNLSLLQEKIIKMKI